MAEFTKELFLKALEDWGRYEQDFKKLPAQEQASFLKGQGYASLKDLLVHVAVWWEEARGIILDTLQDGARPGRKYDFAEFNAASLKRFESTDESEFMGWYESQRQQMVELVTHLTEAQFGISRVQNWLNGVVLEHLKEHGFDAPRFLVIDTLRREWADYRAGFEALGKDEQTAFLTKQGFVRFRELLGHIIAWWEQGIAVIEGSASGDSTEVEDVNAFNAVAVRRFGAMENGQVLTNYDDTRLTLASLVDMLPDEVMAKPNVQTWLRADVIDHYFEHRL